MSYSFLCDERRSGVGSMVLYSEISLKFLVIWVVAWAPVWILWESPVQSHERRSRKIRDIQDSQRISLEQLSRDIEMEVCVISALALLFLCFPVSRNSEKITQRSLYENLWKVHRTSLCNLLWTLREELVLLARCSYACTFVPFSSGMNFLSHRSPIRSHLDILLSRKNKTYRSSVWRCCSVWYRV